MSSEDRVEIDWDPTAYRYVQIADHLAEQMDSGHLPAGAAIPSIDRLTRQYGVGRMTVVRAVQDLAARGRVVVRPGRGTFVLPKRPLE